MSNHIILILWGSAVGGCWSHVGPISGHVGPISGHVGPISGHVGRFRVMLGQFHRFHRFPHTRMTCIIGLGELLPWLSICLLFHVPRLDVFTRKVLYWLTTIRVVNSVDGLWLVVITGLWLVDGRLVSDWSMSKVITSSHHQLLTGQSLEFEIFDRRTKNVIQKHDLQKCFNKNVTHKIDPQKWD